MEYVFYGLLAVAFIAFVVLVIRSYKKKLASGCCGASDESVKKNKVADKDKSHYPYEKTLVVDGMVCKNCSARVENALNSIGRFFALRKSPSSTALYTLFILPLNGVESCTLSAMSIIPI